MNKQAKNNPVEVAAFMVEDPVSGNLRYFIQPWKDPKYRNTAKRSWNRSEWLPDNYSKCNILAEWHTHPDHGVMSYGDIHSSWTFGNIVFFAIGSDGSLRWLINEGGEPSRVDEEEGHPYSYEGNNLILKYIQQNVK